MNTTAFTDIHTYLHSLRLLHSDPKSQILLKKFRSQKIRFSITYTPCCNKDCGFVQLYYAKSVNPNSEFDIAFDRLRRDILNSEVDFSRNFKIHSIFMIFQKIRFILRLGRCAVRILKSVRFSVLVNNWRLCVPRWL